MPLYGIDAYQYYQAIDWRTVAKGTYSDFAICRVSEANAKIDTRAVQNIRGMHDAGFELIGGYMVPSKYPKYASAKSEVALFQRVAAEAGGVDFAAIDLELPATKELLADEALRRAVAAKLIALIEAFEDARGETPIVYGYANFFEVLAAGGLIEEASRCPLWLAAYRYKETLYDPTTVATPKAPPPWLATRPAPVIWQYAADGTRSIPGMLATLPGVDRNVAFYDDVDKLREALGVKLK